MTPLKRVAAVHDLVGLGRCSMSVALPTLAAMGVCVSPAVTAYLSAHTGFPPSPRSARVDLTDALAASVEHWAALGIAFDAVYSGYLAAPAQAETVGRLVDINPNALVLIDPVLGDGGRVYRAVTDAHRRAMAALSLRADVLTPNLTECALLLDEAYDPRPSHATLCRWLEALSGGGARSVVVTGIRPAPGQIGCAVLDRAGGGVWIVSAPETVGSFSGTGDLFASVLLGGLLRGETVRDSAECAAAFTAACVAHTRAAGGSEIEGVIFEPLLGRLIQ